MEQCLSVDQLLILLKLAVDLSKNVSWHLPCSLSFWQHYCLQCPNTFVQEFTSALDLFQLARLKSSTKTRELLFADDAAIVAHTPEDTREICKQFEQAATLFGLTINTKKTVTFYQPPPGQTSIDPHVEIYGTPLKAVKNFTYLGSTVASDNTIDVEINNRIQAASGAFGGLRKRVWSRHGISVSTKCKVYKAIVRPTLLYSAETYTLYRRHFRQLSNVHLRHL